MNFPKIDMIVILFEFLGNWNLPSHATKFETFHISTAHSNFMNGHLYP